MKKIDVHSHIGDFGSWARFDFDLVRLKEQMAEFDIEKIRATHLPEDALHRIYRDNAAKLLGL